MKKFFLLAVLGIMFFSVTSFAQEMNQEMTPEMKMWMEYMTPSDMHKVLEKNVGQWKAEITMWMAPNTPPTIAEGNSVNEMILGGRYLQSKHSGNFSGMPMEGIGLEAYDNAKKLSTAPGLITWEPASCIWKENLIPRPKQLHTLECLLIQ